MLNISFLGGAAEVGASCILAELQGKSLILDCGIRQGGAKDVLPDFKTIQERGGVQAIIISHAHMDHIGALPIISKEYPNAKIYTNSMTKDLMRVLLYDSLKIMNSKEAEIPLYAEKDVEDMLNRVITINYQVDFQILEGIKLSFYPAGHIAGASCVYITSEEGSVFYSGDFSIFKQRTIEGAKLPKLRPDTAIFESTYGDRLHSNREIEEDRLIDIINECVRNKGKMLIPAFALGRAQEVLLIIKSAMNRGKLPKIKVLVDGMVRNINRVYKNNPLYLKGSLGKKVLRGVEPFYDDNISEMPNDNEKRKQLLESSDPFIMISSSGMMTGGPSQFYGEKIAVMENGYIVITGYQDEESPGRKLLNLIELPEDERTMDINGKNVKLKCRIEKVGLSAHGDKNEIKALVNSLSPRNIFFVHGEEGIIKGLAEEVSREVMTRVYVPKNGETLEVIVKKPRKQLKRELRFVMNKDYRINEENIAELWEFVRKNYGERLFTIEELALIWQGSYEVKDKDFERLKEILISCPYFENDLRRFFMFRATEEETVKKLLEPKELKQNEINDLIKEHFKNFAFKKISLKLEEKRAVLVFDFPKSVGEDIIKIEEKFMELTGWRVEINKETNNNAVMVLIKEILKDISINKISFLFNEDKVIVSTNDAIKDYEGKQKIFKEKTGLSFVTNNSIEPDNNSIAAPEKGTLRMEQNEAFKYIDDCFREEAHRPYKKSKKSDNELQLSFISPVVARRYNEKLKNIAKIIGWNISFSNSVNQNEVINLAMAFSSSNGIKLRKNPSFNPNNLEVTLAFENTDSDLEENIKAEFEEATGCKLILKKDI